MSDDYYEVRVNNEQEGWDVLGPPGSAGITEDGHPTDARAWLATFFDEAAVKRFINAGTQRCPCTLVEPCRSSCSCGHPFLSGGCDRCASYGSAEQRQGAAESLERRFQALDDLAASEPIKWEGEDEATHERRQVWCRWCHEGMLATEYVALVNQSRDYPHEDDCTWVLAEGRPLRSRI